MRPPRASPRRLASTLLLCGSSVLASAAAWAQAGVACHPQGNTDQLNACAVQDFQVADIALNIRYIQTMDALPQHQRTALRQQQTAWIKSRAVRCKNEERAHEQQTDWPARYHQCMARITSERQTELDHWPKP